MQPETYELRPATPADAPALVAVMKSVAGEGLWVRTEWPFDEDERLRRYSASLESGRARCIVAERAGRPIGQMTLFEDGDVADLGMFVERESRGRGVGRALLGAAVELALQRGVQTLQLEVYAHNAAALALYRNAGFAPYGETYAENRRSGETFDVIRMRKKVR